MSQSASVSAFAIRLAPPARKKWFDINDIAWLLGLPCAWIVWFGVLTVKHPGGHPSLDEVTAANPYFFPGTLLVIGILVVLRIIRIGRCIHYNTHRLPDELARWKRKWGCMRCGEVFLGEAQVDRRLASS